MKGKTPRPLISILMPVHNAGAFLHDCLASITEQSEKHWELIAVDDFSADNSFDILRQFASADPRIKYLHNTQKGIIPALAKAFTHANGQMVTRMDADDIMPPYKLELLSRHLALHGERHITTGWVEYFSDTRLHQGFIRYAEWLNNLCRRRAHWTEIYRECVIPSACWMAYKKDLESIDAFTISEYPEDYDLVFRFYTANFHVVPVPEILHFWRDHPLRASRTDPNYADQKFFELKLKYFLIKDYNTQLPLFLWGAGKKGKAMARILQSRQIPFYWVSGNPRKTGHIVYHQTIYDENILERYPEKQVIIAISDPGFHENKPYWYQKNACSPENTFEFL